MLETALYIFILVVVIVSGVGFYIFNKKQD